MGDLSKSTCWWLESTTWNNPTSAFNQNDIFCKKSNAISASQILSIKQFSESLTLNTTPSMESIANMQNILLNIREKIEGRYFYLPLLILVSFRKYFIKIKIHQFILHTYLSSENSTSLR